MGYSGLLRHLSTAGVQMVDEASDVSYYLSMPPLLELQRAVCISISTLWGAVCISIYILCVKVFFFLYFVYWYVVFMFLTCLRTTDVN